ncbi:MAG: hypothetical protein HRT88_14790, partial [Lentisphaeraceae bacterium]|nr:hypothetical protein [Lentisphaeraceae bacterium]
ANTVSWRDIDGDTSASVTAEDANVENSGNLDDVHGKIDIQGIDQGKNNYLEINDDLVSRSRDLVLEDDRVSIVHSADDIARITYSTIDYLNIFLSGGNDQIDIASTNALTDTFVLGGAGNDLFNLGSTTELIDDEKYDDAVMDHLEGYLRLDGNAAYNRQFITSAIGFNNSTVEGRVSIADQPDEKHSKNSWNESGYDSIVINDSGDGDTSNEGRISNTQIDGFGVNRQDGDSTQANNSGSLRYYDFDNMTVNLGGQAETLDVVGVFESKADGETDISNADNLSNEHRQLTINAAGGDDVINIGVGTYNNGASGIDGISKTDIDGLPIVDGLTETTGMDRIHADITLNSGLGDDTVHLDDSTDTKSNTGYMTSTMVAGFSRSADSINDVAFVYDNTLENLNLYMGVKNDRLFIQDTFSNNTHIVGNGGSDAVLAETLNGNVVIEGDSTDQNVSALEPAVTGINTEVTEEADHIFINAVAANATVDISTDRGDDIVDIHTMGNGSTVTISGAEGDDGIRVENVEANATLTVHGDERDTQNQEVTYSDKDLIFVDSNKGTVNLNGNSDNDRIYLRANAKDAIANINAGFSTSNKDNNSDTSEISAIQNIDDLTDYNDTDFVKLGAEAPNQWQDYLVNLENAHINDGLFNGVLGNGKDHHSYNDGGASWSVTGLSTLNGAWNAAPWTDIDGDGVFGASSNYANVSEEIHIENIGDLTAIHGIVNIDGVDQDNRNYLEINDAGISTGRQLVVEDDRLSIVHSENDIARINYTNVDFLNLFMSDGNDRVDIASTHNQTDYFILGSAGDDIFNIGSKTDLIDNEKYAINSTDGDSTLDHIDGYLRVDGNAGYNRSFITIPEELNNSTQAALLTVAGMLSTRKANTKTSKNTWSVDGYDTINLYDDGANDLTNEGRISNTQIDGFGIELEDSDKVLDGSVSEAPDKGGLRYYDFDNMTVNLGAQDETLDVVGVFESKADGETDISNADDRGPEHRQLTINAGAGADQLNFGIGTYNLGVNATDIGGLPIIDGLDASDGMDRIHADISVNGQGGNDTVHLDDSGNTQINTAYMTETMVAGLSRLADDINDVSFNYHEDLETLNIYLGSASDRLFIEDTFRNSTNIVANAGDDAILAKRLSGNVSIEGDSSTQTVAEGNDHIFIDTITGLNASTHPDAANYTTDISLDRGDDIVDITTIEAGMG